MNIIALYIFWLIIIAIIFRVLGRWYIRRTLR